MRLSRLFRRNSKQPCRPPLPVKNHSDRPEDGSLKALRWDYEMGEHYKRLLEHPAWLDLVAQLYVVREMHEATWLSGEGDQTAAREGVKAINALLVTPQIMISNGKESEEDLRRLAAERNGSGNE